jgi:acyl-CoA dehydrogenase
MVLWQPVFTIPVCLILLVGLGYLGAPLWLWTLYGASLLLLFQAPVWLWVGFAVIATMLNLLPLRQLLLTQPILQLIRRLKLLPEISDTERAAIEAGTVWVEGEFFSGKPDFQRILKASYPTPSPELQAFLDGPVEQVCRMATDWEIYKRKDLPPEVWAYLKQEGFLGMMIPKEYGGRGFSHLAYSAVMTKLASRSFTHVATVGVTNSLGPAELLMRYGTPVQKAYYLPRLARGEEIPCFALTEPNAGSDAASIQSQGIVFKGEDGQLYLRLNWKKRYITLGAIATLLGLAFRLYDPENLLGKGDDVGITCALVPTQTPGVDQTRRHDPMGVPFYNSPLEGHDVIVSIDQIIGGIEQAGQGWKMIMQCLAAGRGLSFPATCAGVGKLVSRVAGAHAAVRHQFGLPIGRFEGIEEPLARIGGFTYLLDALRLYSCGAVDDGEQPAVVAAIAKYNATELSRRVINDGMDILGGSGICRGSHNLLANIYTATPISITVEGANILTRSLMIFGQGAIRCHPYIYSEIQALSTSDVVKFDRAFWPHMGLILHNLVRAVLLNLSRGHLASSPVRGSTAHYYRKLDWAASTFAVLTELAMLTYGGSLKRHENITGRFADVLSWLYLGTATLRRFEAEGRKVEDLPLVDWVMQYGFAQIQDAIAGLLSNLSIPGFSWILHYPIASWCRLNPIGKMPSDRLGHQVAQILQTAGTQRDRLTAGIYLPDHPDEALGRLEHALRASRSTEPILKKVKAAMRSGQLPKGKLEQQLETAIARGILTPTEAEQLQEAELLRNEAIQVDSFSLEEYHQQEIPSWSSLSLIHSQLLSDRVPRNV